MRQPCSNEKRKRIRESMRTTKERRSRQVCRVFKVKIDESKLSTRQKTQLKMMFVEGKWIKNSRIAWARDNGKSVFECERPHKHEIVAVRNRDGEIEGRKLKYIGSQMAQCVVDEMKSNLKTILKLAKNGLQRGGELKFVSELRSLNLVQYGTTYSFKSDRKMKIQGVSGLVRVSGAGQFLGADGVEIASARLLSTPRGYYVAVTTFTDVAKLPKRLHNGKCVGIDLGCSTTVAFSDGRKQSVLVGETERLKRLQRKLARQQKGSNGRGRTRSLIRVEHEKMANRRNDAANKIAASLGGFANVVMQDEQIANWQRCGHGRKVHHSCLGRLKERLKRHAVNLVMLAKDIPTTKLCMDCGAVHAMGMSDRTFRCGCGAVADRDVHAAENMVRIAEMVLGEDLSVPVGRRELKREEFLKAYAERFRVRYSGTSIHEADRASARR